MNFFFRLCVCAALASLFAQSAHADGPYMRFSAGAGHVDEDEYGSFNFDLGYVGTAAIGYNWFFPESIADLRVELEGSYRYNDIDDINSISSSGEVQAFSAMVNGYFDFRTNLVVVPYVGAGVGATHIRHEDNGAGGALATIDDNDTALSYQVMAGFNYNMSENLAIGVEYRFHETEDFTFTRSAGADFEDEYNHHSAMVTVRLGF